MASIDKKELEHLADLARLELDPAAEEKFLTDFQSILDHFNELSELKPRPISGLKQRRVVLREDEATQPEHFTNQEKVIEAFPDKEGTLLKIPPIFE
jgi:aspartyl-tRNA(Asn)/glutamyl-tRNA(Gln) amidotransferase subunit C